MVYNYVLEHLEIECNIESAGSHGCELSEQDILCHSCAMISFSDSSCLHQDLHRLLE